MDLIDACKTDEELDDLLNENPHFLKPLRLEIIDRRLQMSYEWRAKRVTLKSGALNEFLKQKKERRENKK